MSTYDVPGAKAQNHDELCMGCWAEADNGKSLILVQSTEGGTVIFSVFDTSVDPIVEYRDSMIEDAFKDNFSWDGDDDDKWLWHDKTPFPWDRVIKAGARDGMRFADVEEQISAAEKVAQRRDLIRQTPDVTELENLRRRLQRFSEQVGRTVQEQPRPRSILTRLQAAIRELRT